VELKKLLEVLRDPRIPAERQHFPVTEFLPLTGLRYGEAAGLRWIDVSEAACRIEIRRAISPVGPPAGLCDFRPGVRAESQARGR
jgi:integrase